MKKILPVAAVLLMILFAQSGFAMSMNMIGGVRDSLAIGIMGEEQLDHNVGIRFGVEGCTGKNPIIGFFGTKIYLTTISRSTPMSLGLGLVAYGGNNTEAGISVSAIFDRVFDVRPLFFEVGIDLAKEGKLQAQFGYEL